MKLFIHLTSVIVGFLIEGSLPCFNQCRARNHSQTSLCNSTVPDMVSDYRNNIMMTITLCSGQINVDHEIKVTDVLGLCLTSKSRVEVVCTQSGAGFRFTNVKNLQISNISFDGCGAIIDTREIDNSMMLIASGLIMLNCTNVTLICVNIRNSSGSGMMLTQTRGHVRILNTSFEGNGKMSNESVLALAGGLYVEFQNTPISDEITSMYSIEYCKFVNNKCNVPLFTDGIGSATKYEDFGRGGGVRLYFKGNATNNNVSIKGSVFKNNYALWGGGLHVKFQDNIKNNSIIIQNSHFVNNCCFYNGGGLDLGFAARYGSDHDEMNIWNKIDIQKCNISKNFVGAYGGGVRIFSTHNKFVAMNITFSHCSVINNKALYGPAMDMLPHSEDIHNNGYLSSISFKDCNFKANEVIRILVSPKNNSHSIFEHYESGKGCFVCSDYFLYFSGQIIFEDNIGSAMHLSSCRLHFESESYVEFINNTGYDGGAVVLFGASVLYVSDNSTFLFVNNSVVHRGGAIMYISSNEHDFIAWKSCFIQYLGSKHNVDQRDIRFSFLGNKAMYGQAVFASTLRPCQRLCIHKRVGNWTVSNHTSVERTLGCVGNFTFDSNNDHVSTAGERLTTLFDTSESISVIPGQEVHLKFNMSDELKHPSYDTFHASVQNISNGTVKIDPAYTYVSERKVIKLYGMPGGTADVILTNTEFQPIVVVAHVEMNPCPPGLVLGGNDDEMRCICSADTQNKTYVGITRCSTRKTAAYIRSGYWIGYISSEVEQNLITGQCPRGFCQFNLKTSNFLNEYELPQKASVSILDNYVCGTQRTGKLCGSCRSNNSVFFHSGNYQCKPNDNTCKLSVLYLVSELLPVTLIFFFIIVYDIHFTGGMLNSLVFYVQIIDNMRIDVEGVIEPYSTIKYLFKANQLVYGILNLNFFNLDELSYCVWSTATALDVLALKYVTITYSLILIFVTVTIMKSFNPSAIRKFLPCISMQFSAKTSMIHGLVAFLVICYAQTTKVSMSILTPGYIHWIGSVNTSNVVYYSGDTQFMDTQHLKYAIPAILFTISFTFIPPLLLIVYPLCYKVFELLKIEESSCIRLFCLVVPLEKLNPIFDSFQSCFKDKYRFFAGLFFIYRLSILTILTVTDSLTLFYTLLELQLVTTLVLHGVVQPYKQQWHNVLDIMLLGLLGLINAMTMYNYQRAYRDHTRYRNEINGILFCQVFLAFLPLIFIALYSVKKIYMIVYTRLKERNTDNQELTDTLRMVDDRELSNYQLFD